MNNSRHPRLSLLNAIIHEVPNSDASKTLYTLSQNRKDKSGLLATATRSTSHNDQLDVFFFFIIH